MLLPTTTPVGCSSLSVCLSVCPENNSETKDQKVFKLGIGNKLGITTTDMVWWLKGQRSRLGLGLCLTAIRSGFELYECLLVVVVAMKTNKPRLRQRF